MGLFGVTVSSQVGKNPSQTTITAKCPRLRCRSREQAAIALRSLFEFAVRETNKSCGCFVLLYVFGCKGTIFPSHSDTFLQNNYGLITHSFVWGSTLFVYSAITFFFDTIRMSSYLMLPESFGGLASLVFFTNSSYSLPFS